MKNMKMLLCLISIVICFGCRSRNARIEIEMLKKENDDLKAKVAECEKRISYKNAIIENLQKIHTPEIKGNISLPLTSELRRIPSHNIRSIYNLLKQQNFYGVTLRGKVIQVIIAKDIFKSGSDKLTTKGEKEIKKLANVLRKNIPRVIEIKGHTDNTGLSEETASKFIDNYGLSSARAKEAKYILLKHLNLKSEKISVEGLGDSKPLASNRTKAGKNINRRLEIFLHY